MNPILVTGGPILDVATAPRAEAQAAGSFAPVETHQGDAPDPDEIRGMLTYEGGNGRIYDSPLVKLAKTYLSGRPAYAVCFEHAPIAEGEANWNNQVTRIVGQTIGMLARQEDVTPEGIYALLHSAIEQLHDRETRGANETDWFATTWDLICRLWATEESQILAEHNDRRQKVQSGEQLRQQLIAQVREARPQDVPADADAAQVWFLARMIASDGRRHHVMRPDGSYNIRPISDSMLIPMIRDLGMEEVIPTTEIRGKQVVTRTATALLNEHAVPITTIECSARESVAYIDGAGGHKVLHVPVHRLNPKLVPIFDLRVDEWLQALAGQQYDRLTEWLAHSLDVRRAICALNLFGPPGTGKGMLAAGLAECFEGGHRNDGRALGKFNVGLLDSPVVNCDEGVPQINNDEAMTVDQAFRSLVTGGRITIRAMHRDPFNADIYPRILFTSNDRDIVRSIVGHRDLTADDIQAIEQRLLSIEVLEAAQSLLTRRGNYKYTAGWVAGHKGSEYTLANHIFYLFENRKPSLIGAGRLLVEGETSTQIVREMRLRSKGAQTVLRSLVKMIEASGSTSRRGLHVHENRVWVTPAGVVEIAESGLTSAYGEISLPIAGRVLRQFSKHDDAGRAEVTSPPGSQREQRARWVEIDLGILFEEGMRYGMTMARTERMLAAQPGGDDMIAVVLSGKGTA